MREKFGIRLTTMLLSASLLMSSTGIYGITASAAGNVSADADGSVISGQDVTSEASLSSDVDSTDIAVEGGELDKRIPALSVEGGDLEIVTSSGNFGGGDGTQASPRLIEDAADLIAMQGIINNSANSNKYFKLAANIDLSGLSVSDFSSNYGFNSLVTLNPASSDANVFFYLDGDGKTISGLDVNVASSNDIDAIGIFGYVNSGSTIANVTFDDCTIRVGNKSVVSAAIVVQNLGTISDCAFTNVTMDFTGTKSDVTNTLFNSESADLSSHTVYSGVSAIAADNMGTIADCQVVDFTAKISGDRRYIGAVAGQNRKNITDTAVNYPVFHSYGSSESTFSESPTGSGTTASYVGGVVGYNHAAASRTSHTPAISGCSVNISSSDDTINFAYGDYVGGIGGYNAGDIGDCIVTGNFESSADNDSSDTSYAPSAEATDFKGVGRFGGIAGINSGDISSSTAYNIGMFFTAVSDDAAFGGIAGESSGDINGCVSSGYADSDSYQVGLGGVVGSVLTGNSLVNCYAFVFIGGSSSESGALIGKNGTYANIGSSCYWSSEVSGTKFVCPGVPSSTNDMVRALDVFNFAKGTPITLYKSWMTHSWGVSGTATVGVDASAASAKIVNGSGYTFSDAGSTMTVNASTAGASAIILYNINVSFPAGIGASSSSMLQQMKLPVIATNTTTTDTGATPKVFAGMSADNPILISSYNEFSFISKASNVHYSLNADIAMGAGWTMCNFSGTLDGNDHTITIIEPLFNSVSGSRNSNYDDVDWKLNASNIVSGYVHDVNLSVASTVTGSAFGSVNNATFENITYSATGSGRVVIDSVNSGAMFDSIGGNVYMYKCYVSAPVDVTESGTSGGNAALVGVIDADNFIIDNCGVSSVITLTNNLSAVAGLIGKITALNGKATISNCYASGKVRVIGTVTPAAKIAIGTIATSVHNNINFSVANNVYSVAVDSETGYSIVKGSANYTTGISSWKFSAAYFQVALSNAGTTTVTISVPSSHVAFSAAAASDFEVTPGENVSASTGGATVSDGTYSFTISSSAADNFVSTIAVVHTVTGLRAVAAVRSDLTPNASGYYEIYTPEDLVAISELISAATAASAPILKAKIMLCADIDMTGKTISRMGKTAALAFNGGEFIGKLGNNGEKFKIINLEITQTEKNGAVSATASTAAGPSATGLFGFAKNCTFKDFAFENCKVSNVGSGTGMLVGCADQGSATGCIFENIDVIGCTVQSLMTSGTSYLVTHGYVGGLVGAIRSSASSGSPYTIKNITIRDCQIGYAVSTFNNRMAFVGGVIGGATNCRGLIEIGAEQTDDNADINIMVENTALIGLNYIGGIIGFAGYSIINSTVEGNIHTQNITPNGTISINGACVKNSSISAMGAGGSVGGIIAGSSSNITNSSIKNCLVDTCKIDNANVSVSTSGKASASGIAGVFGGTISKCTVTGSEGDVKTAAVVDSWLSGSNEAVSGTSIKGNAAGGILSRVIRSTSAYSATVDNCSVLGVTSISPTTANNANTRAGGIISSVFNTTATATNCKVGENVTISGAFNNGGITSEVNYGTATTYKFTAEDCISYAKVECESTVTNTACGGIIGNFSAKMIYGEIQNCVVGGQINNNNNYAGGIVGYYSDSNTGVSTSRFIKDCTVVAQMNINPEMTAGTAGKIIGKASATGVFMSVNAGLAVSGVVLSSYPQGYAAYGDADINSDANACTTYVDVNRPGGNMLNGASSAITIDAESSTTGSIVVSNQARQPFLPGDSQLVVGYDTDAQKRIVFNTDTITSQKKVNGWKSLSGNSLEITSATVGTSDTNAVVNIKGKKSIDSCGIFGAYNIPGINVPGTENPVEIQVCIEVICTNFSNFNLSGTGTAADPYIIMTADDLDSVRYAAEAAGVFAEKYYELGADIVFDASDFELGGDFYNSGKGFSPIGFNSTTPSSPTVFTGHFSGKRTTTGEHYSISGIVINSSNVYSALFANSSGASFDDLYLTDCTVTASGADAGAASTYTALLSAYSNNCVFNNVTLDNVSVTDSSDSGTVSYAGSMSAYAIDADVDNCTASNIIIGSVTASATYSGGLFGHAHQSAALAVNDISDLTMTNISVYSQYCSTTYTDAVGGIAAQYNGTISGATLSGRGTISGSRSGGAVGILDETGITTLSIQNININGIYSIVSPTIQAAPAVAAAGIIAKVRNGVNTGDVTLSISNCTVSNKVSVSAVYYASGIVGHSDASSGTVTITGAKSFAAVSATDSANASGTAAAVIAYIHKATTVTINASVAGGTVKGAKFSGGFIGEIHTLTGTSLTLASSSLVSNGVVSSKVSYTDLSTHPAGCALALVVANVENSTLPANASYSTAPFVNIYYSSFQNNAVPITGNSAANESTSPDMDATLCDVQGKLLASILVEGEETTTTTIALNADGLDLSAAMILTAMNGSVPAGTYDSFTVPTNVAFTLSNIESRTTDNSSNNLFAYDSRTHMMTIVNEGTGNAVFEFTNGIEISLGISAYTSSGGGESVNNPIVIVTPAQLNQIRTNEAAGNSLYYAIGANLDCTGYDFDEETPGVQCWETVPNFSGHITGKYYPYDSETEEFNTSATEEQMVNYVISNLQVNNSVPSSVSTGFFGTIAAAATVDDMTFSDCFIEGSSNVGMLAGTCAGEISNITVNNCSVTATNVWLTERSYSVGDIVYYSGSYYRCISNYAFNSVAGNVYPGTSDGNVFWSLIPEWIPGNGYIQGDYCINAGAVYMANGGHVASDTFAEDASSWNEVAAASSVSNVGGVVGNVTSNSATGVSGCETTGSTVITSAYLAGGIAGLVNSQKLVSSCEVTAGVTVNATDSQLGFAGGIAAVACRASDCTVSGATINSNYAAGGVIGGDVDVYSVTKAGLGSVNISGCIVSSGSAVSATTYASGIIAYVQGNAYSDTLSVTDCKVGSPTDRTVTVTSSGDSGGIISNYRENFSAVTISGCDTYATVTSSGTGATNAAAGIIAQSNGTGFYFQYFLINDCVSSGSLNANTNVGGILGYFGCRGSFSANRKDASRGDAPLISDCIVSAQVSAVTGNTNVGILVSFCDNDILRSGTTLDNMVTNNFYSSYTTTFKSGAIEIAGCGGAAEPSFAGTTLYDVAKFGTDVSFMVNNNAWISGDSYNVGEVVYYDGSFRVCIANHTASASILPTNGSYWLVPAAWSADATFSEGSYCIYEHLVYKATQTHTSSEDFEDDAENWQAVYVAQMDYSDTAVVPVSLNSPDNVFYRPAKLEFVYPSSGQTIDLADNATSSITVHDYTDGIHPDRTISITNIYTTASATCFATSIENISNRINSVITAHSESSGCSLVADLGNGLIVGIPLSSQADGAVSDGSMLHPYLITSEAVFADYFFGSFAANNAYYEKYYKQTVDLDFDDIKTAIEALDPSASRATVFSPIGTSARSFVGGYDGGNKRIYNFAYDGGIDDDYVGLFGHVSVDSANAGVDYRLKNIHIELKGNGVAGDENVGGLVGYYNSNLCTIYNCSVVNAKVSGNNNVGGLVGQLINGGLDGCFTSCAVASKNYADGTTNGAIGGLVGFFSYSTQTGEINVSRCFSSSDVLGWHYVSGFIGKVAYVSSSDHGNINLSDSSFTGSVYVHDVVNGLGNLISPSIVIGHLGSISGYSVNEQYVLAQNVYVAGSNTTQYDSYSITQGSTTTNYYSVLFGTVIEKAASENVYFDSDIIGRLSVYLESGSSCVMNVCLADGTLRSSTNLTSGTPVGDVSSLRLTRSSTEILTSPSFTGLGTDGKWNYSDSNSYPILNMYDSYSDAYAKMSALPLIIDERENKEAMGSGVRLATKISAKVDGNAVSITSSTFSSETDTVNYCPDYDLNLVGNGANKKTDFLFNYIYDYSSSPAVLTDYRILRNSYFIATAGASRDVKTPYITLSAEIDGYNISRNIRISFEAEASKTYVATERQLRAIMDSNASYPEIGGTKFASFKNAKVSTQEVYLCADIELNGSYAFEPISNFTGNFNGNGCIVSNLYINKPSGATGTKVGFFTELGTNDKNIKGITFNNVKIIGQYDVGTLAGKVSNTTVINNCVVTTTYDSKYEYSDVDDPATAEIDERVQLVTNHAYIRSSECVVKGDANIGGLIGTMSKGAIGYESISTETGANAYTIGQTSGAKVNVEGQNYVGGFIGMVEPSGSDTRVLIANSFATGNVTKTNTAATVSDNAFGGFVGMAKMTESATCEMIYTFATGNVTANFSSLDSSSVARYVGVGGYCGISNVDIHNSFSSGTVSSTTGSVVTGGTNQMYVGVGGLVGYSKKSISDSYSSSSVEYVYDSVTAFSNTGYAYGGVGGVCGITEGPVADVYSSGSIRVSHIGVAAFAKLFYGGAIGKMLGSATAARVYYDTWTNNIAGLTAIGGTVSKSSMLNAAATEGEGTPDTETGTNDCRGYTTDDFCDGVVIGTGKLSASQWGSSPNAYPYLKTLFDSVVSDYVRYPAVLSVVAVRPNDRDTAVRDEEKGYSMALTMPSSIVIEDTLRNERTYNLEWTAGKDITGSGTYTYAGGVIQYGNNIFAPIRTSNERQYLQLVAWVRSYVEGGETFDNDGADGGYKEYATREVSKLYEMMLGTEENPYLISTVRDLACIDSSVALASSDFHSHWYSPITVNGVNYSGKVYYKLMVNIDMTKTVNSSNEVIDNENPYVTINKMAGNDYGNGVSFHGFVFDGNDYVIEKFASTSPFITELDNTSTVRNIVFKDIAINSTDTENAADIAIIGNNKGVVDGITVYNVGDEPKTISAANGNAAAIAAVNNGTIKNCVVDTAVSAVGSNSYVGGIAAKNESSASILRSTSVGTLTAGTGVVGIGGIVGKNSANGTIGSCFSIGSVSGSATSFAGGFVGDNAGIINTSYSRTAVTGYFGDSTNHTGSFAGANTGTISGAYAAGRTVISGTTASTTGSAFCGTVSTGSINNAFADKALLGSSAYMLLSHAAATEDIISTTAFISTTGFVACAEDTKAYPQLSDIVNIHTVDGYEISSDGYEMLKYRLLKSYSEVSTVTVDSAFGQYINTLSANGTNSVSSLDNTLYSIKAGVTDVNGLTIAAGAGTITASRLASKGIGTKIAAGSNTADEIYFYPSLSFAYSVGAQNPNFADGEGTENDPYVIRSVASGITAAQSFGSLSYYGLSAGTFFKMEEDAAFGGSQPYEPIKFLKGTLNGDGHVVSDMAINNNNALIGTLSGKVEKLGIVGININKGLAITPAEPYFGMIAAKAVAGAQIVNSYAVGEISISGGNSSIIAHVGGLVGYVNGATVSHSVSSGKIINSCQGTDSSVGGIAGLMNGGTVSNCESTAYVYGSACVGGIAGKAGNSAALTNVIFAGTAADDGLTANSATRAATATVSHILAVNDASGCTVTGAYYDKQLALFDESATYPAKTTFEIIKLTGMTEISGAGGWTTDSATIKQFYPNPVTSANKSARFSAGLNFAIARITVSLAGGQGTVFSYDSINIPTPVSGDADDTVSIVEDRSRFGDSTSYLVPTAASASKAPGIYAANSFTGLKFSLNTGTSASFEGNTTGIFRYIEPWIVKIIDVEYVVTDATAGTDSFDANTNFALLVRPTMSDSSLAVSSNAITNVMADDAHADNIKYQKMVVSTPGGINVDALLPTGCEISSVKWQEKDIDDNLVGNETTAGDAQSGSGKYVNLSDFTGNKIRITVTVSGSSELWGLRNNWNSQTATLS